MCNALRSALLWIPLLLVACSPADDSQAAGPAGDPSASGDPAASAAAVEELRTAIASLESSPEHSDEEVEVQHILIAFQGAQNATVKRSKAEAEALTADLFRRAKAGEDFTALMKANSTDPGPGTYPMTTASRGGMVAGFGDVGWRLQPGMIGVAPHHPTKSPFGWHIIKRLK